MDTIVATQQRYRATPNFITDEFVRLANTCRLWLRVLYLDDIASDANELNMAYYHGESQCDEHSYNMPYQEKPPQWVWKAWQEVLQKSCLSWNRDTAAWSITVPDQFVQCNQTELLGQHLTLPTECTMSLGAMAAALPPAYQQLLGTYELPHDDGAALAQALADGTLTHYSDGTVKEGCAGHAYTLRTHDDNTTHAITGGGPTCGDPDTVSSLRPEHNGAIVGSIWMWLLELNFNS